MQRSKNESQDPSSWVGNIEDLIVQRVVWRSKTSNAERILLNPIKLKSDVLLKNYDFLKRGRRQPFALSFLAN